MVDDQEHGLVAAGHGDFRHVAAVDDEGGGGGDAVGAGLGVGLAYAALDAEGIEGFVEGLFVHLGFALEPAAQVVAAGHVDAVFVDGLEDGHVELVLDA